MREWKWFPKERILKRLKWWYDEEGPAQIFSVPKATADQLDAFIAQFTSWHDRRSDRAWAEYRALATENQQLRFKLEWLMKQPALQHYRVELDMPPKRTPLPEEPEPAPPTWQDS